jgi:hypothetical protein
MTWRKLNKSRKAPNTVTLIIGKAQVYIYFAENRLTEAEDTYASFLYNEDTGQLGIVFTEGKPKDETTRYYKVLHHTPSHCRVNCGMAVRSTPFSRLPAGKHTLEFSIADFGYGEGMIINPPTRTVRTKRSKS